MPCNAPRANIPWKAAIESALSSSSGSPHEFDTMDALFWRTTLASVSIRSVSKQLAEA